MPFEESCCCNGIDIIWGDTYLDTGTEFGEVRESYFGSYLLWMITNILNRLLQISKLPHLRRHVRSIKIDPTLLPTKNRHLTELVHKKPNKEHCCIALGSPPTHLAKYIQAQRDLENSGRGVEMLTEAFSGLPNLKSAWIGPAGDYIEKNTDDYKVGNEYGNYPAARELGIYNGQRTCVATYRASECGVLQFRYLIRAAAQAKLSLEKMIIYEDHENYGNPRLNPSMIRLSSADLALARIAFANLRELKWGLPDYMEYYDRRPPHRYREDGQIAHPPNSVLRDGSSAALLDLMPSLEQLYLGPRVFNNVIDLSPPVIFKQMVGTMEFSPLRFLRIKSWKFHEDEFVDFVSSHSTTLKSIDLASCGLYEGHLKSLCHRLRDCLRLDKFRIQDCFEEHHTTGPQRHKMYDFRDEEESKANHTHSPMAGLDYLDDFVTRRASIYPSKWMAWSSGDRGEASETNSDYEQEHEDLDETIGN